MATRKLYLEDDGGTLEELTEATWEQEIFGGDKPDTPKLREQQYVLFDEMGCWPSDTGWPRAPRR